MAKLSEQMVAALLAVHEAGGQMPRSNESHRKINPYTANGREFVRAGTADALERRGLVRVSADGRVVVLTEAEVKLGVGLAVKRRQENLRAAAEREAARAADPVPPARLRVVR